MARPIGDGIVEDRPEVGIQPHPGIESRDQPAQIIVTHGGCHRPAPENMHFRYTYFAALAGARGKAVFLMHVLPG